MTGARRVLNSRQLPQADRHHVPHALDPARPVAAATDSEPGRPQPRDRRHDPHCRRPLGPRLRHLRAERARIPHGVPMVPFLRDGAHKDRLGLAGRKSHLHFRTYQSRQRAGVHYPGHAADRRRLPGRLVPYRGRHPSAGQRHEGEIYRESLVEMAEKLGVAANVRFVNQYLGPGRPAGLPAIL